jgi:hypothetical protein
MEGSCENCNEPSGSIKYWEIFEKLSDWRLLKKDSAPWSLLVTIKIKNYTLIVCILTITLYTT